jgi:hypothetical protein
LTIRPVSMRRLNIPASSTRRTFIVPCRTLWLRSRICLIGYYLFYQRACREPHGQYPTYKVRFLSTSVTLSPTTTAKMGYSSFITFVLLLSTVVSAQSCQNYGTQNGSICACPPGFGGNTCSQPSCGGNLFQGLNRTLVPASPNSSTFPNTTAAGCSCQAGWIGTGCNVCQTTNACQIAYAAATGTNGSASASSVASSGGNGQNDTMVCNTQPQVYAAGEMSCEVIVRPFLLFLN